MLPLSSSYLWAEVLLKLKRFKGSVALCPRVRMRCQLLLPDNGHFLPVRVETPAEVWHLVLLCEDWIEISQLALN